jgi:UDP-N-acetylmuramoyl-tripeptide--D-alanyl-D-alanine ligase
MLDSLSCGPLLCVGNTRKALYDLAGGYRATLTAEMVGVTGSVGKTTVKELVADMLSEQFDVARTKGNWNNDIGLPLSLLEMSPDCRYGVFEVGMNHPGELEPLCRLLKPRWAVMTTIGPVHLEYFPSVQAIANEKASLLRALDPNGRAVLCRDEQWFPLLRDACSGRVVTISFRGDEDADYTAVASTGEKMLSIRERASKAVFSYEMPLPGDYFKQNALRSIALGREMGVEPVVIASALQKYRPQAMRWNQSEKGGILFINDAYNANPVSMSAVLATFAGMTCDGRKWLVLGGMHELGASTREKHLAVGRDVAYGDWAGLITVGELGALIADGAVSEGFPERRIARCSDAREASGQLRERARPRDCVLLKASRGEHLEDVLKAWETTNDVNTKE